MGVCFSKRAPDSPGTPGDSIAEQRARSFSKRTEMWERTGTVQCTFYSLAKAQLLQMDSPSSPVRRLVRLYHICRRSRSPEFADLPHVSL